jgi:large subunit ribosomal protein L7e
LKELGLKEVNNVSFVRADSATLDKLLLIRNYVAYGYPTKSTLDDIIRKRGYLKKAEEGKGETRVPISDNVVIEDLLGSKGIICIEDLIEAYWKCKANQELYEAVKAVMWPI